MADPTRTWLAECYSPRIDRPDVARAEARALEAADELRKAGHAIVYLGALLVAEDEVVFHAFSAPEAATVREVGRLAGIRFDRVVEVETVPAPGDVDGVVHLLAGLSGTTSLP